MQVRVTITDEWGAIAHEAAVNVNRHLFQDAAAPIDFPSNNSIVTSFRGNRKQVAAAITESLMSFFASHDTEMGYPKPDPNYQPFPGAWWCATCGKWIPGEEVTNDETHDLRHGGCGQFVE